MVYEMRVYTLQPGKVAAFQELIEKEALPVISKHSKLVGWVHRGRILERGRPHLGIRGPESPRARPQSPRRGSSASGVSPQGPSDDREPVQQDSCSCELLSPEIGICFVRDQGDLVLLACPGQGTREGLKQIGGEPNGSKERGVRA